MTRLLLALALAASPDTKGWETKKLSQLGKERFGIEGRIKVPPKSKTQSTGTAVGNEKGSTLAYVTLPDGLEVMLMERSAKADKDPARLEQVLAMTGALTTRRDPTGYFITVRREDGWVVQGANWAVEPGIDCATAAPMKDLKQVELVSAICLSLSK